MPTQFTVRTSAGEFGPVTGEQLRQWADQGRITPNDLVRPEGKTRWYRADSVNGLFPSERLDLDPPGRARPQQPPPRPHAPSTKKPRLLLGLLLLVVLFLGVVSPRIPIWTGIALAALVVLYVVPFARRPLRPILRVSPDRPVRGAFKLTAIAIYGGLLVLSGVVGANIKEEMQLAAAQRAAEEAEQQRLIAAANQQVDAIVAEAESHLSTGEIDLARTRLSDARSVKLATNRAEASRLAQRIEHSGDSDHLFELIVSLPNDAFIALRENEVPPALDFGYTVLTERAIALIQPQIDRAATVRAEREQARMAEAEARRQREAEERARQRRDEEARLAAEQASKEAAQKEIQDKLDAYMAVLELAEVQLIDRVSVRRIGSDSWEATLTVTNIWHLRHKQIRLQDAQTLWEAWALIASPDDPDRARIKLVDQRGNKVGGSGLLGGSMISVDD